MGEWQESVLVWSWKRKNLVDIYLFLCYGVWFCGGGVLYHFDKQRFLLLIIVFFMGWFAL